MQLPATLELDKPLCITDTVIWLKTLRHMMMAHSIYPEKSEVPDPELIIVTIKEMMTCKDVDEAKTIDLAVMACMVTVDNDKYHRLSSFVLEHIFYCGWDEAYRTAHMSVFQTTYDQAEKNIQEILEALYRGSWAPRAIQHIMDIADKYEERVSLN